MDSVATILYFGMAFVFAFWARTKGKSGLFHFLLALLGPLGWIVSFLILGPKLTTLVKRISDKSRLKPHELIETESRERFRLQGSGAYWYEVVGESNYVDAIASLFNRPSGDQEIFVDALLLPEPTNKYDANAIRVVVKGRTVGYVPRDRTSELHPLLNALAARNQVLEVGSRAYLGKDDFTDEFFGSVSLDLPYELELALPLNSPPTGSRIWPQGAGAVVSLAPEATGVLSSAMTKSVFSGKAVAYFELLAIADDSAKPAVQVSLEGQVIGHLAALRAKKLHPFIAQAPASRPFFALGRIVGNSVSVEVTLDLKQPEKLSEEEISKLEIGPAS